MPLRIDITGQQLRTAQIEGQMHVYDPLRKKYVLLTPEEHVRQMLLGYLIHEANYPSGKCSIERKVIATDRARRYDLLIYGPEFEPWMLVECKSPEVPITDTALHQLLHYHSALRCRYWLLSNGHQHFCADAQQPDSVVWLDRLPAYER